MPVQTWAALISEPYVADGTAYASSTSATDVSPTPNTIIPANYLIPGSTLLVKAAGKFSTTSAPTLNLGVYWGGVAGTAICTTGALTCISGAASTTFAFEALLVVRTIGSAGTIFGIGEAKGIGVISTIGLAPATSPAVTTSLDTTSAKALTLGATWGTNSASNTLTCNLFTITQLY